MRFHSLQLFAVLAIFIAALLPDAAFGGATISAFQDAKSADEQKQDDQKQDDGKKEDEKQDEKEDGQADLEAALEQNQNAKTVRDLDKVIRLLESALKKDLDDESKTLATKLLKSTLLNQAKQTSGLVFKIPRDRRWQFFRRQSLRKLEQLVKMDEPPAEAYMLIARLQGMPNGNKKMGREAIAKAIELAEEGDKNTTEMLLIRAALAEDNEQRLEDIAKILKEDPKNIRALGMRALVYEENEEFEKSIEDLNSIIEIKPDQPGIRERLYQLYVRAENLEEAANLLEKIIEDNPESTDYLRALAALRMQQGKDSDAIAPLSKIIEIDESDAGALLERARLYIGMEDYQNALDDTNEVLDLQPGSIGGLLFRSIANSGLKDFDAALEDVDVLIDNAPNRSFKRDFRMQKARILIDADRSEEGLEIYAELIEDNEKDWQVYRSRGDAFLSLGDHEKAIADYESALKIDKDDSDESGILNNLAWLLSTTPFEKLRDGKRAVELATKSCEMTDYKEAHILSTLASSYAEADDFENAIKWGQKSVDRGIETKSTQLKDLERELVAYKAKKKWREFKEESGPEGEIEFDLTGEKSDKADDKSSDEAADKKDDKDDDDKDKS